jgi:hypothetical protein
MQALYEAQMLVLHPKWFPLSVGTSSTCQPEIGLSMCLPSRLDRPLAR